MSKIRLAYFSASGNDFANINKAIGLIRKNYEVEVIAKTKAQLLSEKRGNEFIEAAFRSDIIYIALHGNEDSFPPYKIFIETFEKLKENNKELPYIHIQPGGAGMTLSPFCEKYSSEFDSHNWNTICRYSNQGGFINFQNMILFLMNIIHVDEIQFGDVILSPEQGIYHPDFDYIPEVEEYYAQHINGNNPIVGLWFHNTFWKNDNLDNIDKIIREVERQGMGIIAVFLNRNGDRVDDNLGPQEVVEKYFMSEGKSRISLLLNALSFSMNLLRPELKGIFEKMNVPILQVMNSRNSYEDWKNSDQGVTPIDIIASAALPEFDGALINMNTGTTETDKIDPITGSLVLENIGINERIEKMVSLGKNWIGLSRKSNEEKKIAIVFHNYPPRNDRIGNAIGLDTFASIKNLINSMRKNGFKVDRTYQSGDEIAQEILSNMTYDKSYVLPETMPETSIAEADKNLYMPWHEKLPHRVKEHMTKHWGRMPGELFVHEDILYFGGVLNGNLFITMQPPRGEMEKLDELMHDTDICPTHHYLAKYRWIKHTFRADAVIHVGTHGTLEWLPGKSLGLSEECYPDLSIMDLPNIYYYIISNPGEGIQAKRRSYCCIIDHLSPPTTNSDLYEELEELETAINNYYDAKSSNSLQSKIAGELVLKAMEKAKIFEELNISNDDCSRENFDALFEKVHAYLEDISDTMISAGLHTVGIPPSGEKLVEFIVQLTRLKNENVPSLREAVLHEIGYDYDELVQNKGKIVDERENKTGGKIIKIAHNICIDLVRELYKNSFESKAISHILEKFKFNRKGSLGEVLEYISEKLYPNIERTHEEIDSTLKALNGRYVQPGPSGAPSRGEANILPTGKNFYSVDPTKIPTEVAWETGVKLAETFLEKYSKEEKPDLKNIALYMTSTSIMRSKGESLAEMLYFLGVKPIWEKTGKVFGLEIIPLSELQRPRYDVFTRLSGSFRDAFPNLMDLINDAVQMVSVLNEPPESNILKANILSDAKFFMEKGISESEAMEEASFRVFSSPPGTYGAGVKELVECSQWDEASDLGNSFINWSSYAYKEGYYGVKKQESFTRILSRVEATIHNNDTREYDMYSCTDYYNYYGGLISAVKSVKKEYPLSFYGDSSDPSHIKVRTLDEESKYLFRSKLLNPKFINGLREHGYKGSGDLSKIVDIAFGWDSTSGIIDNYQYEMLSEKYALDSNMVDWMKQVNPYALKNIVSKLLEAYARGMWEVSQERLEKLQDLFLEIEGETEELTS